MPFHVLDYSGGVFGHAVQNATLALAEPREAHEVEAWAISDTGPMAWSTLLVEDVHFHPTPVRIETGAPDHAGDARTAQVEGVDLIRAIEVR